MRTLVCLPWRILWALGQGSGWVRRNVVTGPLLKRFWWGVGAPSCHLAHDFEPENSLGFLTLSCGPTLLHPISSPGTEVVLSRLWTFLKYQTPLHHGAPTNSLSKPGTWRPWQLLKFSRGSCSTVTLITSNVNMAFKSSAKEGSHQLPALWPSPGLPGCTTEHDSNESQLPSDSFHKSLPSCFLLPSCLLPPFSFWKPEIWQQAGFRQ